MKISKVQALTILVVLLLLVNLVTLAGVWKYVLANEHHGPPPPHSPGAFLIEKLNLNEEQVKLFDGLREEHFSQMKALQEHIKVEKEALYDVLQDPNADSAKSTKHMQTIMRYEEQLERITFEHFKQVRAICNPQQQQHFDVIIDEVIRMMNRQPRKGPPPPLHP